MGEGDYPGLLSHAARGPRTAREEPSVAARATIPVIVAVDGGGSFSAFVACDGEGRELARVRVGSTSHKSVGERNAAAQMARGFSLLAQKGLDPSRACVTVCGLSGFDSPSSQLVQNRMLDACGIARGRRVVCNDSLLPLFAAGLRSGAVVVAGTGSIAVALDETGSMHRVGGWGYEWSDAGSGHWMGARALQLALAFRDGAGDRDELFDEVLAIAGLRTLDELAWWAVDGPDASEVARFAPAVMKGASPVASAIRDAAADELARLYAGLALRAGENGAPRDLVFAGGLFSSTDFQDRVERGILRACGSDAPHFRGVVSDPVRGGVELGKLVLSGCAPQLRFAKAELQTKG